MVASTALDRARFQLPLLRVRPGAVVRCVFGDVGPLWYGVHWANQRQWLCSAGSVDGCALCEFGASRVLGCTVVQVSLDSRVVTMLLELSPLAFSNFETRLRFAGLDLRPGVACEVSRVRARGALRIEPVAQPEGYSAWLDGERRLLNAFAVLHGLPLAEREETIDAFMTRVAPVVSRRAEEVASRIGV